MRPCSRPLSAFIFHPAAFLLALALLAYAPFFWQHGFYWDEAPWAWIYYRLGPAALAQTFSTSRPFWGLLYQVSLPLIGPQPWAWQLLMILLRWLGAVLVWALFRRLYPRSRLPLWTAALFLVFPALGQNFIALMYSHFYLVFDAFLLSLYFSLLAAQKQDVRWHLPALALSALNLLTLEHFYFLEFLRLALFWLAVERPKPRRAVLLFLPYLGVFLAVTVWRAFFFTNQNASYSYQTLTDLKTNLFWGIGKLLLNILRALGTTLPAAWLFPFEPIDLATLGLYTAIAAFSLALAGTLLTGLYFHCRQPAPPPAEEAAPRALLLLGLLAWLLGGGAFWLIGERTLPQLHFSADRFSLSFMLGSSLILAALLGFGSHRPRLQLTVLALLIGFSIGKQFQTGALYRRDWNAQRVFFWQLSWRAPSIAPGTTLITNDLPLTVFSDNSLSGPLNWIYNSSLLGPTAALAATTRDPGMNYILYYVSVRAQEGRALDSKLEAGHAFAQNYLATTFYGSTSQVIVLNFSPPGCLRVLDPEIDPLNRLLPPDLREAAALSDPHLIRSTNPVTLPTFYTPEIPHGWCYYFSQAELARQDEDWASVLAFSQQAQALGEHSHDPLENFVFIEALAHSGQSQAALNLTRETYRYSKEYLRAPLCALWTRIARQDVSAVEMAQDARDNLDCAP